MCNQGSHNSLQFQLKKKKGFPPGERVIQQYHYTTWPDHGVPQAHHTILNFVKTVRRHAKQVDRMGHYPILVHCSAGVGRTGTFIALDWALQVTIPKHLWTKKNQFAFS